MEQARIMTNRIISVGAAVASAACLICTPAVAQNRRAAAGAKSQKPAAAAPRQPALYLSPAAVRQLQRALQAAGEKPGNVDGVWGDATSKALASYQSKKHIDPSGHPDVMTLAALGLSSLLNADAPAAAASQPLSAEAMKTPGVELYVSPAFVRQVQLTMQKKGAVPGNILGVWHNGSTQAALKFEKANGLDASGNLSLQLIHALGLSTKLTSPGPPADVQMLTDYQAPFAGSPIYLATTGVRAIQKALNDEGDQADVPEDGHWTEKTTAALKAFQKAHQLAPTGTLTLRTLRALGFEPPIPELARESAAKS
jgi:peptidoglycan hydrolase-like protein with peptidoglycan-binding domain